MDRPTPQQLLDDRNFIRDIVDNRYQVIHADFPERVARVVEILTRGREVRRGGPTRHDLFDLQQFFPGEGTVLATSRRVGIIDDILRRIREAQPGGRDGENENPDEAPPPENAAAAPPVQSRMACGARFGFIIIIIISSSSSSSSSITPPLMMMMALLL